MAVGEQQGPREGPGPRGTEVVHTLEVALARLSPRARRALPVTLAGAAALLAGVVVGATEVSREREVAQR
ncbi:MAG TPA: hypothetical protein VGV36_07555, partial [Solirubrobacteraceae bacterium]|nr:hypothetical protein [Solirubrobacteraceae bacterium]